MLEFGSPGRRRRAQSRRAPCRAVPSTLQASLMARLDRLGREGGGAGRRLHRPRVPLSAAGGSSPPAGPAAGRARGAGAAELVFAAARRPKRATPSSTRWSRTPPTRACSRAGGRSFTPRSPGSSKPIFQTLSQRNRKRLRTTMPLAPRAWRRRPSRTGSRRGRQPCGVRLHRGHYSPHQGDPVDRIAARERGMPAPRTSIPECARGEHDIVQGSRRARGSCGLQQGPSAQRAFG